MFYSAYVDVPLYQSSNYQVKFGISVSEGTFILFCVV